jgi:hypothetical protein
MKHATHFPASPRERKSATAGNGIPARKERAFAASLRRALDAWALRSLEQPRYVPYY